MIRQKAHTSSLWHSASLLTFVNVLITCVTLVSGLYIARQLNPQQYGQYAYMANVFLLMLLFLGFGLSSQISKDAAEHDPEATATFQERLRGLIALRIGTALLAIVSGTLLWLISSDIVYLYAGADAALFMCVDFVVAMFSGLQYIKRVALLLLVQPVTFILLLLVIPFGDEIAVYRMFLVSQIASAAMALLLGVNLPALHVMPRFLAIKHLPWSDMVAGQVYIIVLLQTAYSAYGVTLLGALKHYDDAGEVSIALTIVRMLPLLFGSLITVLYYPRLCSIHKQGHHQQFQHTTYVVYQVSTIIAAGCAALLIVYSDIIVHLLYTSRHAAAIPLLRLVACMSLFSIIDQVLTWTFVASDQAAKALPPLIARMGLMIVTLPLALIVDPALLPQIVAGGYIGSSLAGWLFQLHATQFIKIFRAAGFTLAMVTVGLAIGFIARFVIPWPHIPYSEEGSLVVAAVCYAVLGIGFLWQQWKTLQALPREGA